jgi:hypothetical protein
MNAPTDKCRTGIETESIIVLIESVDIYPFLSREKKDKVR